MNKWEKWRLEKASTVQQRGGGTEREMKMKSENGIEWIKNDQKQQTHNMSKEYFSCLVQFEELKRVDEK